MSTTIAVALIASISTLAGSSISGYIAFLVNRTNSKAQRAVANDNRIEQQSRERRQIRRDAYVQFLNQLSEVEQELDIAWRSKPPSDMEHIPSHIDPVTAELDKLQGLANLVILEGPAEVAEAAQALQARLTLESVDVIDAAKKSDGNAPCLQDEQRFMKVRLDRAAVKGKLIKAAQQVLDADSRQDSAGQGSLTGPLG